MVIGTPADAAAATQSARDAQERAKNLRVRSHHAAQDVFMGVCLVTREEAHRICDMFYEETFRLLAMQEAPPRAGPHPLNHEGLFVPEEAEYPREANGPPEEPHHEDRAAPRLRVPAPKAAAAEREAGAPPPPPPKAAAAPPAQPQYDPCRFCGVERPDHPGSRCPARQTGKGAGKGAGAPGTYLPGAYQGKGGNGARYYAIWWPRSAGGPWYGHWGAMRSIYPEIVGKRCDTEESAREFLRAHGDTEYASRVLMTTPP